MARPAVERLEDEGVERAVEQGVPAVAVHTQTV
jgi:hypothetical protein